jgi:hypothetical protein
MKQGGIETEKEGGRGKEKRWGVHEKQKELAAWREQRK